MLQVDSAFRRSSFAVGDTIGDEEGHLAAQIHVTNADDCRDGDCSSGGTAHSPNEADGLTLRIDGSEAIPPPLLVTEPTRLIENGGVASPPGHGVGLDTTTSGLTGIGAAQLEDMLDPKSRRAVTTRRQRVGLLPAEPATVDIRSHVQFGGVCDITAPHDAPTVTYGQIVFSTARSIDDRFGEYDAPWTRDLSRRPCCTVIGRSAGMPRQKRLHVFIGQSPEEHRMVLQTFRWFAILARPSPLRRLAASHNAAFAIDRILQFLRPASQSTATRRASSLSREAAVGQLDIAVRGALRTYSSRAIRLQPLKGARAARKNISGPSTDSKPASSSLRIPLAPLHFTVLDSTHDGPRAYHLSASSQAWRTRPLKEFLGPTGNFTSPQELNIRPTGTGNHARLSTSTTVVRARGARRGSVAVAPAPTLPPLPDTVRRRLVATMPRWARERWTASQLWLDQQLPHKAGRVRIDAVARLIGAVHIDGAPAAARAHHSVLARSAWVAIPGTSCNPAGALVLPAAVDLRALVDLLLHQATTERPSSSLPAYRLDPGWAALINQLQALEDAETGGYEPLFVTLVITTTATQVAASLNDGENETLPEGVWATLLPCRIDPLFIGPEPEGSPAVKKTSAGGSDIVAAARNLANVRAALQRSSAVAPKGPPKAAVSFTEPESPQERLARVRRAATDLLAFTPDASIAPPDLSASTDEGGHAALPATTDDAKHASFRRRRSVAPLAWSVAPASPLGATTTDGGSQEPSSPVALATSAAFVPSRRRRTMAPADDAQENALNRLPGWAAWLVHLSTELPIDPEGTCSPARLLALVRATAAGDADGGTTSRVAAQLQEMAADAAAFSSDLNNVPLWAIVGFPLGNATGDGGVTVVPTDVDAATPADAPDMATSAVGACTAFAALTSAYVATAVCQRSLPPRGISDGIKEQLAALRANLEQACTLVLGRLGSIGDSREANWCFTCILAPTVARLRGTVDTDAALERERHRQRLLQASRAVSEARHQLWGLPPVPRLDLDTTSLLCKHVVACRPVVVALFKNCRGDSVLPCLLDVFLTANAPKLGSFWARASAVAETPARRLAAAAKARAGLEDHDDDGMFLMHTAAGGAGTREASVIAQVVTVAIDAISVPAASSTDAVLASAADLRTPAHGRSSSPGAGFGTVGVPGGGGAPVEDDEDDSDASPPGLIIDTNGGDGDDHEDAFGIFGSGDDDGGSRRKMLRAANNKPRLRRQRKSIVGASVDLGTGSNAMSNFLSTTSPNCPSADGQTSTALPLSHRRAVAAAFAVLAKHGMSPLCAFSSDDSAPSRPIRAVASAWLGLLADVADVTNRSDAPASGAASGLASPAALSLFGGGPALSGPGLQHHATRTPSQSPMLSTTPGGSSFGSVPGRKPPSAAFVGEALTFLNDLLWDHRWLSTGFTALHAVCEQGHAGLIARVTSQAVSTSAGRRAFFSPDSSGLTPLHHAVRFAFSGEPVEILLTELTRAVLGSAMEGALAAGTGGGNHHALRTPRSTRSNQAPMSHATPRHGGGKSPFASPLDAPFSPMSPLAANEVDVREWLRYELNVTELIPFAAAYAPSVGALRVTIARVATAINLVAQRLDHPDVIAAIRNDLPSALNSELTPAPVISLMRPETDSATDGATTEASGTASPATIGTASPPASVARKLIDPDGMLGLDAGTAQVPTVTWELGLELQVLPALRVAAGRGRVEPLRLLCTLSQEMALHVLASADEAIAGGTARRDAVAKGSLQDKHILGDLAEAAKLMRARIREYTGCLAEALVAAARRAGEAANKTIGLLRNSLSAIAERYGDLDITFSELTASPTAADGGTTTTTDAAVAAAAATKSEARLAEEAEYRRRALSRKAAQALIRGCVDTLIDSRTGNAVKMTDPASTRVCTPLGAMCLAELRPQLVVDFIASTNADVNRPIRRPRLAPLGAALSTGNVGLVSALADRGCFLSTPMIVSACWVAASFTASRRILPAGPQQRLRSFDRAATPGYVVHEPLVLPAAAIKAASRRADVAGAIIWAASCPASYDAVGCHLLPGVPRVKALGALMLWANPVVLRRFMDKTAFMPLAPRRVNDLLALALLPQRVRRTALLAAMFGSAEDSSQFAVPTFPRRLTPAASAPLTPEDTVSALLRLSDVLASPAGASSAARTDDAHAAAVIVGAGGCECARILLRALDKHQGDSWRVGPSTAVPATDAEVAAKAAKSKQAAAAASDDDVSSSDESSIGDAESEDEASSAAFAWTKDYLIDLPLAALDASQRHCRVRLSTDSAFRLALVCDAPSSVVAPVVASIAARTTASDVIALVIFEPSAEAAAAARRRRSSRKRSLMLRGAVDIDLLSGTDDDDDDDDASATSLSTAAPAAARFWRRGADGETFVEALGATRAANSGVALDIVRSMAQTVIADYSDVLHVEGDPGAVDGVADDAPSALSAEEAFQAAVSGALHRNQPRLALTLSMSCAVPPNLPMTGASCVHVVRRPAPGGKATYADAVMIASALSSVATSAAKHLVQEANELREVNAALDPAEELRRSSTAALLGTKQSALSAVQSAAHMEASIRSLHRENLATSVAGWRRAVIAHLVFHGATPPLIEAACEAAQVSFVSAVPHALAYGRASLVDTILRSTMASGDVVPYDAAFTLALCPDPAVTQLMTGRFVLDEATSAGHNGGRRGTVSTATVELLIDVAVASSASVAVGSGVSANATPDVGSPAASKGREAFKPISTPTPAQSQPTTGGYDVRLLLDMADLVREGENAAVVAKKDTPKPLSSFRRPVKVLERPEGTTAASVTAAPNRSVSGRVADRTIRFHESTRDADDPTAAQAVSSPGSRIKRVLSHSQSQSQSTRRVVLLPTGDDSQHRPANRKASLFAIRSLRTAVSAASFLQKTRLSKRTSSTTLARRRTTLWQSAALLLVHAQRRPTATVPSATAAKTDAAARDMRRDERPRQFRARVRVSGISPLAVAVLAGNAAAVRLLTACGARLSAVPTVRLATIFPQLTAPATVSELELLAAAPQLVRLSITAPRPNPNGNGGSGHRAFASYDSFPFCEDPLAESTAAGVRAAREESAASIDIASNVAGVAAGPGKRISAVDGRRIALRRCLTFLDAAICRQDWGTVTGLLRSSVAPQLESEVTDAKAALARVADPFTGPNTDGWSAAEKRLAADHRTVIAARQFGCGFGAAVAWPREPAAKRKAALARRQDAAPMTASSVGDSVVLSQRSWLIAARWAPSHLLQALMFLRPRSRPAAESPGGPWLGTFAIAAKRVSRNSATRESHDGSSAFARLFTIADPDERQATVAKLLRMGLGPRVFGDIAAAQEIAFATLSVADAVAGADDRLLDHLLKTVHSGSLEASSPPPTRAVAVAFSALTPPRSSAAAKGNSALGAVAAAATQQSAGGSKTPPPALRRRGLDPIRSPVSPPHDSLQVALVSAVNCGRRGPVRKVMSAVDRAPLSPADRIELFRRAVDAALCGTCSRSLLTVPLLVARIAGSTARTTAAGDDGHRCVALLLSSIVSGAEQPMGQFVTKVSEWATMRRHRNHAAAAHAADLAASPFDSPEKGSPYGASVVGSPQGGGFDDLLSDLGMSGLIPKAVPATVAAAAKHQAPKAEPVSLVATRPTRAARVAPVEALRFTPDSAGIGTALAWLVRNGATGDNGVWHLDNDGDDGDEASRAAAAFAQPPKTEAAVKRVQQALVDLRVATKSLVLGIPATSATSRDDDAKCTCGGCQAVDKLGGTAALAQYQRRFASSWKRHLGWCREVSGALRAWIAGAGAELLADIGPETTAAVLVDSLPTRANAGSGAVRAIEDIAEAAEREAFGIRLRLVVWDTVLKVVAAEAAESAAERFHLQRSTSAANATSMMRKPSMAASVHGGPVSPALGPRRATFGASMLAILSPVMAATDRIVPLAARRGMSIATNTSMERSMARHLGASMTASVLRGPAALQHAAVAAPPDALAGRRFLATPSTMKRHDEGDATTKRSAAAAGQSEGYTRRLRRLVVESSLIPDCERAAVARAKAAPRGSAGPGGGYAAAGQASVAMAAAGKIKAAALTRGKSIVVRASRPFGHAEYRSALYRGRDISRRCGTITRFTRRQQATNRHGSGGPTPAGSVPFTRVDKAQPYGAVGEVPSADSELHMSPSKKLSFVLPPPGAAGEDEPLASPLKSSFANAAGSPRARAASTVVGFKTASFTGGLSGAYRFMLPTPAIADDGNTVRRTSSPPPGPTTAVGGLGSPAAGAALFEVLSSIDSSDGYHHHHDDAGAAPHGGHGVPASWHAAARFWNNQPSAAGDPPVDNQGAADQHATAELERWRLNRLATGAAAASHSAEIVAVEATVVEIVECWRTTRSISAGQDWLSDGVVFAESVRRMAGAVSESMLFAHLGPFAVIDALVADGHDDAAALLLCALYHVHRSEDSQRGPFGNVVRSFFTTLITQTAVHRWDIVTFALLARRCHRFALVFVALLDRVGADDPLVATYVQRIAPGVADALALFSTVAVALWAHSSCDSAAASPFHALVVASLHPDSHLKILRTHVALAFARRHCTKDAQLPSALDAAILRATLRGDNVQVTAMVAAVTEGKAGRTVLASDVDAQERAVVELRDYLRRNDDIGAGRCDAEDACAASFAALHRATTTIVGDVLVPFAQNGLAGVATAVSANPVETSHAGLATPAATVLLIKRCDHVIVSAVGAGVASIDNLLVTPFRHDDVVALVREGRFTVDVDAEAFADELSEETHGALLEESARDGAALRHSVEHTLTILRQGVANALRRSRTDGGGGSVYRWIDAEFRARVPVRALGDLRLPHRVVDFAVQLQRAATGEASPPGGPAWARRIRSWAQLLHRSLGLQICVLAEGSTPSVEVDVVDDGDDDDLAQSGGAGSTSALAHVLHRPALQLSVRLPVYAVEGATELQERAMASQLFELAPPVAWVSALKRLELGTAAARGLVGLEAAMRASLKGRIASVRVKCPVVLSTAAGTTRRRQSTFSDDDALESPPLDGTPPLDLLAGINAFVSAPPNSVGAAPESAACVLAAFESLATATNASCALVVEVLVDTAGTDSPHVSVSQDASHAMIHIRLVGVLKRADRGTSTGSFEGGNLDWVPEGDEVAWPTVPQLTNDALGGVHRRVVATIPGQPRDGSDADDNDASSRAPGPPAVQDDAFSRDEPILVPSTAGAAPAYHRPLFHVHCGGSATAMGAALWGHYCYEHFASDPDSSDGDPRMLFEETREAGRWNPRCCFVDIEGDVGSRGLLRLASRRSSFAFGGTDGGYLDAFEGVHIAAGDHGGRHAMVAHAGDVLSAACTPQATNVRAALDSCEARLRAAVEAEGRPIDVVLNAGVGGAAGAGLLTALLQRMQDSDEDLRSLVHDVHVSAMLPPPRLLFSTRGSDKPRAGGSCIFTSPPTSAVSPLVDAQESSLALLNAGVGLRSLRLLSTPGSALAGALCSKGRATSVLVHDADAVVSKWRGGRHAGDDSANHLWLHDAAWASTVATLTEGARFAPRHRGTKNSNDGATAWSRVARSAAPDAAAPVLVPQLLSSGPAVDSGRFATRLSSLIVTALGATSNTLPPSNHHVTCRRHVGRSLPATTGTVRYESCVHHDGSSDDGGGGTSSVLLRSADRPLADMSALAGRSIQRMVAPGKPFGHFARDAPGGIDEWSAVANDLVTDQCEE